MDELNEFDNMMELSRIGGKPVYDLYCSKIKEYLRENPGKSEREIANETDVPLIAIKRAIREGVLEYVKDKGFVEKEEDTSKDDKRKKLIEELSSAFDEKLPTKSNEHSQLVDDLQEIKNRNQRNQLGWKEDR